MCDRIVISTDGCFLFCGFVGEIIFVAVSALFCLDSDFLPHFS